MSMVNIFMGLMDNIFMNVLIKLMPLYLYHQILIYIYYYIHIMYVVLIFDSVNLRCILFLMMGQIFSILINILILNFSHLRYIFNY
jgi:hypothetical protein